MSGSDFADDAQFRMAVAHTLESLLAQVDEIDFDDLDPRLSPGNLQVLFEDTGSTFVLSQQTPTHELWLSANLTAWHFRRVNQIWRERDTGEAMLDLLGRLFSEKVGFPIVFEL